MKINIPNASYWENYVFKVWETCFPLGANKLGNVIGSYDVIIVDWVSTHVIGIAISRN